MKFEEIKKFFTSVIIKMLLAYYHEYEVLDENGEILIRKTNLSRRQVELVEKNFLNSVAKKLNGSSELQSKNPGESFDPMVT